jgi:hypothetical protein
MTMSVMDAHGSSTPRIVITEAVHLHSRDGSLLARCLLDAAVHLRVRPGHIAEYSAYYDCNLFLWQQYRPYVDSHTTPSVGLRARLAADAVEEPSLESWWQLTGWEGQEGTRRLRAGVCRAFCECDANTLESEFSRLAAEWRDDVAEVSSYSEMVSHPAYLRIIALGEAAVPLLLRELRREPNHWFVALHVLTGVDPVRPESRARLYDMAHDWIVWGQRHQYLV